MMKKCGNLYKVIACVTACFMLLIGNPIKTNAVEYVFWKYLLCDLRGHHTEVTEYVNPTCYHLGYWVGYCTFCGDQTSFKYDYKSGYKHCYPTDPYKEPRCEKCGYNKYLGY